MRKLMEAIGDLIRHLANVLLDEFTSLLLAVVSAVGPAWVLTKIDLAIPHWPTLDVRGWIQVQLLVYFVFRVFFLQRRAAR